MNKKYNPMSKEFQEDAKRLGLTGNQLIQKYINEGELPNPSNFRHIKDKRMYENAGCKNRQEYDDKCAQRIGFKDRNDRQRDWQKPYTWRKGWNEPASENENCSSWLGVEIGEKIIGRYILPILLGKIKEEMPVAGYPFDFVLEDGTKVDVKVRCLIDDYKWLYEVSYNNKTDYFLLIAIDNREDRNIVDIWLIHKNDNVQYGHSYSIRKEFWDRTGFSVCKSERCIKKLEKYSVIHKLSNLKEICDRIKEI